MTLPKAVLCLLDPLTAEPPAQEGFLRTAGFATATLSWRELTGRPGDWTQLLPVLEDPGVQAWVFCGRPEAFTTDLLARIALLTLALKRPSPPLTAFVLTGSGEEPEVADPLAHVRMFRDSEPFSAKLMAIRKQPRTASPLPLHLAAHLSPLIGQWLEIGPVAGATWNGFMAGVIGAEAVAFGVGPRGRLPHKCTLNYPQCGIRGTLGQEEFSACAARNALDQDLSCYLRVEGDPRAVLVTGYPEEVPDPVGATPELMYVALC